MKKQKYILSALAALSVLTAATSVTAFAGEETPAPENNSLEIITEVAEIPAIAVDSDAEEITKLDAEIIANAEIEETAESEEETVADAETEETTESEEETHKQYGFRKWDCEDWCNFASWLGSAGWRCGRDQMPDVAEENEEAAAEEETEAGSETTYIDDWYDNYFDWNQFSEMTKAMKKMSKPRTNSLQKMMLIKISVTGNGTAGMFRMKMPIKQTMNTRTGMISTGLNAKCSQKKTNSLLN